MFSSGVALVVGGTGGLGRATCELFARSGSPVAFTFLSNRERATALEQQLSTLCADVRAWPLDLSSFEETEARLLEVQRVYGRIHSVVYAAGPKIVVDYVSRHDPATAARIIQQDVIGFFHLARAALPLFKLQGGGSLTAITTTQGGNVEVRGSLSASPKAAIESMTRTIAKEEARFGIRANCVRAGWAADEGLGMELMENALSEKARANVLAAIPMRRLARPVEIAEAVVFLASDRASFITGISMAADGGQHL